MAKPAAEILVPSRTLFKLACVLFVRAVDRPYGISGLCFPEPLVFGRPGGTGVVMGYGMLFHPEDFGDKQACSVAVLFSRAVLQSRQHHFPSG